MYYERLMQLTDGMEKRSFSTAKEIVKNIANKTGRLFGGGKLHAAEQELAGLGTARNLAGKELRSANRAFMDAEGRLGTQEGLLAKHRGGLQGAIDEAEAANRAAFKEYDDALAGLSSPESRVYNGMGLDIRESALREAEQAHKALENRFGGKNKKITASARNLHKMRRELEQYRKAYNLDQADYLNKRLPRFEAAQRQGDIAGDALTKARARMASDDVLPELQKNVDEAKKMLQGAKDYRTEATSKFTDAINAHKAAQKTVNDLNSAATRRGGLILGGTGLGLGGLGAGAYALSGDDDK